MKNTRYDLSKKERIAKENFFNKLQSFNPGSTEMFKVKWGREDMNKGGTITLPWNMLVEIFWDYVNEAKGKKENVRLKAIEITK